MLGTVGATVVASVYILFAGLLGIAAGGLICLISRRTWTAKAVLFDTLTGITVAVAFAYFTGQIAAARGTWEMPVWPMFASAPTSVLIRHLLLLSHRSRANSGR